MFNESHWRPGHGARKPKNTVYVKGLQTSQGWSNFTQCTRKLVSYTLNNVIVCWNGLPDTRELAALSIWRLKSCRMTGFWVCSFLLRFCLSVSTTRFFSLHEVCCGFSSSKLMLLENEFYICKNFFFFLNRARSVVSYVIIWNYI